MTDLTGYYQEIQARQREVLRHNAGRMSETALRRAQGLRPVAEPAPKPVEPEALPRIVSPRPDLTAAEIIEAVAVAAGIETADVLSRAHPNVLPPRVVVARQIARLLNHELLPPARRETWGARNHSSLRESCLLAEERLRDGEPLYRQIHDGAMARLVGRR